MYCAVSTVKLAVSSLRQAVFGDFQLLIHPIRPSTQTTVMQSAIRRDIAVLQTSDGLFDAMGNYIC